VVSSLSGLFIPHPGERATGIRLIGEWVGFTGNMELVVKRKIPIHVVLGVVIN
jgi:hypothetical protein